MSDSKEKAAIESYTYTLDTFDRWAKHLQTVDRFHLNEEDEKFLAKILDYSMQYRQIEISPSESLYRARLNPKDIRRRRLEPTEMGAPLPGEARAGRLNPSGIPYLYLSGDAKTSIAEIRPWVGAHVTVGRFVPARSLKIINLEIRGTHRLDTRGGVVNQFAFLHFIAQILAQPQDPQDEISYIPTQYFAEKFKRYSMDGLKYSSVLNESGTNLVLFDPGAAICKEVSFYKIKTVTYSEETTTGEFYLV